MATMALSKVSSGTPQFFLLVPASRCLSTTSPASKKEPGQARKPTMSTLEDSARLASMRKGPGYRSSFSGHVATVFGANGFLGRGVCSRLGKHGTQMILPYRGDHYDMLGLKVSGDLGQVLFTPYNLRDEDSIRRSMKYSNVVINLIGQEKATRNFTLKDVHVTGAARLARIARESGIERFVHMSHVNAREHPPRIFSQFGSEWLRTKWEGEQAVLQEFPDATIIRATDMYGPQDKFITAMFNPFRTGLLRQQALWKKGLETVKAPVYWIDVVSGIVNSLDDPAAKGVTYEAFGPDRFLLADLVDWMAAATQRDPEIYKYKRVDLRFSPGAWAKIIFSDKLPLGRICLGDITLDRMEREALTDDVLGLPNLSDLGVKTHRVKDKMLEDLKIFDAFPFAEPAHIFEDPVDFDPKPLTRIEESALRSRTKFTLLGSLGIQ